MTCFLKPLFLPVSRIFKLQNKFNPKTWGEINEIGIIHQKKKKNHTHKRNEKAKIYFTQYLKLIRVLHAKSP